MSSVKHKILVLSGKGGVGKSTFTAHLAHGLAADDNKQVGNINLKCSGYQFIHKLNQFGCSCLLSLRALELYSQANVCFKNITFLWNATTSPTTSSMERLLF